MSTSPRGPTAAIGCEVGGPPDPGGPTASLLCCPPAATAVPAPAMTCLDPSRTAGQLGGFRPSPKPRPPWRDLVERCRQGDDTAWEEFHGSFQQFAHQHLRRQFHRFGPTERADLASAVLERLIPAVRAGHIRGTTDASIGAYLARAVRNQALDLISRRRHETPIDDALHYDRSQDTQAQADQRALVRQVMDIVAGWSPIERFVFVQKTHGVSSEWIKH